jgi:hypothetical protein
MVGSSAAAGTMAGAALNMDLLTEEAGAARSAPARRTATR